MLDPTKEIEKNQSEFHKLRLIPPKHWHRYHKNPSQGCINSLVLDRKENGLNKCIVRLNGRLYLIENEFFQWIFEHREAK